MEEADGSSVKSPSCSKLPIKATHNQDRSKMQREQYKVKKAIQYGPLSCISNFFLNKMRVVLAKAKL